MDKRSDTTKETGAHSGNKQLSIVSVPQKAGEKTQVQKNLLSDLDNAGVGGSAMVPPPPPVYTPPRERKKARSSDTQKRDNQDASSFAGSQLESRVEQ